MEILKWTPTNLNDALYPISVMNWFMGIKIFEYPKGHHRPALNYTYIITMAIVYYYILFTYGYEACDYSGDISGVSSKLLGIAWHYNQVVALIAIFINLYYNEVTRLNIQRIELMNENLKYFGFSTNYRKIFLHVLFSTLLASFGILLNVIAPFVLEIGNHSWSLIIYCISTFEVALILQITVDLNFGIIVTCIGYSFENINAFLDYKNSKLVISNEFNLNTVENSKNLLQLVKHLHLELSKISWEVNRVYGLQILMSMASNVVLVTILSYYTYTLSGTISPHFQDFLPTLNAAIRCLVFISRIFYVNIICANVTSEAKKAKELIFRVTRSFVDVELQREIEQFSLQMEQRPLFFSMFGLSVLNNTFITNFLGTIAKYLVLLIQMEPWKESNHGTTISTMSHDIQIQDKKHQ